MKVAIDDDVLDVARLAPGLMQEPLGASLITRVKQLSGRSADPRIVDALLEMVLAPPATSQGIVGTLWAPVFNALEEADDPRIAAPLEKFLAKKPGGESLFWPQHLRKVEKLLSNVPDAPKADAALKKTLAALKKSAEALKPATQSAPPAKKAKVANFGNSVDDRLVAGDAFLEAGDPRGLAIQLEHAEMKGTATAAQLKELRAIIKQHSDKWIPAELRAVLTPGRYEFGLGYLDACEVITTSLAQQRELANHEGWSTVRSLATDELPLLTSPAFTALEEVSGLTLEQLYALGATSRPLPIHTAATVVITQGSKGFVQANVGAKWSALPKLRALQLHAPHEVGLQKKWENWSWIAGLPVKDTLESLTVLVDLEDGEWVKAFDAFPKLKTLTLVAPGIRRWTLRREDGGFVLRVGVSDSDLDKHLDRIAETPDVKTMEVLEVLRGAPLIGIEYVDMLKNPLKHAVKRYADNAARAQKLPVVHLPGSFGPGGGSWDLGNAAMKQVERFAKASRRRK